MTKAERRYHRVVLIRVGLTEAFEWKLVQGDPVERCRECGVEPEAMMQRALETDIYGRWR